MSIIITNITSDSGWPDRYILRINQNVICEFIHIRKHDGLAQCLRDAADAVDTVRNSSDRNILK